MKFYQIFIIILLFTSSLCNIYAQAIPPWYEPEPNKATLQAKIDSIPIYEQLIAEENAQANYRPNVTGMIIGGCLAGTGIISIIYAATYTPEKKQHNSNCSSEKTSSSKRTCEFQELVTGSLDGLGDGITVGLSYLLGITFSLIGLPIFIYNSVQYNYHKEHANYRDELQERLMYYKSKNNSTQLIIAPTVNLLGGTGFNATLRF